MDTISRENNSSMLPVGGIIVGVIGLLLGVFALVQASKANKAVAETQTQLASKIDTIEQQAGSAAASADKVQRELTVRMREVQDGFNTIGPALAGLQASVTKLEEAQKRPAPSASKSSGPVVAGPGEYVIKPGDSFAKIGRAQGFSIADIQAVNPGVDSSSLKVGQKIKLPQKR